MHFVFGTIHCNLVSDTHSWIVIVYSKYVDHDQIKYGSLGTPAPSPKVLKASKKTFFSELILNNLSILMFIENFKLYLLRLFIFIWLDDNTINGIYILIILTSEAYYNIMIIIKLLL